MNAKDSNGYKKRGLSASSNGRGIKIGAVSSPGTLIHTALVSQAANEWDELYLHAVNTSAAAVKLTLQWGGVAAPDDEITLMLPPETGLISIIPGHLLQNGASVRAFAATANTVVVHGYVNRYADRE